jgi:hypothetical protein
MLRVARLAGLALRDDFSRVLIQGASLRNQVNGFVELSVVL